MTVLSASAGQVQINGVDPVVNYSNSTNVAGTEPLFSFTAGGQDKLSVTGNALDQNVDIHVPGGYVAFDDLPVGAGTPGQDGRIAFASAVTALGAISNAGSGYANGTNVPLLGGSGSGATANIVVDGSGAVTGVTLVNPGSGYTAGDSLTIAGGNGAFAVPMSSAPTLEALAVYGLEGNDLFNVTAGELPVFFDGGDPIGQTPGDRFNVLAGSQPVAFESGPEPDEGGILVGGNARISYDHIEAGQVTDASCALILGTNGDDDITIIARTQLSNPTRFAGTDGNKDFTSSVNGGIEVLWVNTDTTTTKGKLYLDAMSGDDDVVVRAPALDPNSTPAANAPLAWNMNLWVAGGTPSAATGDQGDVFELETPGANRVRYTPTSSETGVLELDSVYAAATVNYDTTINLVSQFFIDCDGDQTNEYASSPGGFESLVYDGEGQLDALTVVLPAGAGTRRRSNTTRSPAWGRSR